MSSRLLGTLTLALSAFAAVSNSDDNNNDGDSASSSTTTQQPSNIIMIMIDDLGRSDISAFGAEWDTPNIDQFISESVTFSHHYIGYVCSASRSQFLTGRYSYHMGYGELDVFDIGKAGGFIPRGSPTVAEYLKYFSNYGTYAIGKWQLGSSSDSQIAVGRGFDKFWGFNGGMEEYNSKLREWTGDEDNTYYDFYIDNKPSDEASGTYSTDQYFPKAIEYMETHVTNEETENNPFFVYLSLQAIHGPFTESLGADTTNYEMRCKDFYRESFIGWPSRTDVCAAMIAVDTQFGIFLEMLKTNEVFTNKNIWENTLIILTSDNGGSLDKGSCNYPLRGGKNTFFEGGQRVIAIAGGGVIGDSQKGKVLDGLVSNVDWVPTMLSFAQLLPSDYKHVTFGEPNGEDLPMVLDGYNLYPYIMGETDSWFRDHLVFHVKPNLKSISFDWKYNDVSRYSIDDMDELALIFYDDNGDLWKFLNVEISSNIIGDPVTNAGYCWKEGVSRFKHTNKNEDDVVNYGIYNLNNDKREEYNYESFDNIENGDKLESIISEKLAYYTNAKLQGSVSSHFLYGHFSCLLSKTSDMKQECFDAAATANAWVTFLTDKEIDESVLDLCSFGEGHTIYKLLTTPYTFPDDNNKDGFLDYINDNTENIEKINVRPATLTARKYTFDDDDFDLDNETPWDDENSMTNMENNLQNQKDNKDNVNDNESNVDEKMLDETGMLNKDLDSAPEFNSAVNSIVGIFLLSLCVIIACVTRNLKEKSKIDPNYVQIP